jgi:hypothetical protein
MGNHPRKSKTSCSASVTRERTSRALAAAGTAVRVVMEPALRLIQGDAPVRASGYPTKLTEPRLGCAPRADVRNVGSRTPVRGSVLTTRADLNCLDFLCSQSWGCRTAG